MTSIDVLAVLDRMQADLDALRALILTGSSSSLAAVGEVQPEPEWATLKQAAAVCRVHVDTMASRCRAHGLGWRAGGRDYRVDMVRVRAWAEGRPYNPLPAALPEGSGKPGTVPDAERSRRGEG